MGGWCLGEKKKNFEREARAKPGASFNGTYMYLLEHMLEVTCVVLLMDAAAVGRVTYVPFSVCSKMSASRCIPSAKARTRQEDGAHLLDARQGGCPQCVSIAMFYHTVMKPAFLSNGLS